MDKIKQIIQSFLGTEPKDHGCNNWSEMQDLMHDEINKYFQKGNQLLEHKDFITQVVNFHWNDLQLKLQQDNLGTVERKLYESEAKKAKDLIYFITDDKYIPNKLMLKKQHVQVLVDSEEKQQCAIQILQKHNEEIWDDEEAMSFDEHYHFLSQDTNQDNWYVSRLQESRIIVTLEELDLILTNQSHEKQK